MSFSQPLKRGLATIALSSLVVANGGIQYELMDMSFTAKMACIMKTPEDPTGNQFSLVVGTGGPNWTCWTGNGWTPSEDGSGYMLNIDVTDTSNYETSEWVNGFGNPTFTMGSGAPVPEFSTWVLMTTLVCGVGLAIKMKPQMLKTSR